jgi:nicotinic acid mononucleotide adenylyltransferase
MTGREQTSDEARVAKLLATVEPAGEPRMAFLRRAPNGIRARPGTLLCLSASFNPITVAHVRLIDESSRLVPLDEVLLLLARANVDKSVEGFPLARRLAILTRFAETRPAYSVAAVSHGRFFDKAQAILAQYPPGIRLVFIVGLDTLVRLFDPKYYDDRDAALATLFATSEVIAANRAPEPPEAMAAFLGRPEVVPFAHAIHCIRLPPDVAAISATEVRRRLAEGRSVDGLVPAEIRPLLHP